MTKEEIMKSIPLKKMFCTDNDIPISVFDNPYFYERLETLDVEFDCIRKFNEFCDALLSYKNEDDFFKYRIELIMKVTKYIQNSTAYKEFEKSTFAVQGQFPQRDLYVEENDGYAFVSIALKRVNFFAMKHYAPSVFDYAKTWEEFMSKFTGDAYLIHNDRIQNIILSDCSYRNIITYAYSLMNRLCNYITDLLHNINIYSVGWNEILIKIPSNQGIGISLSELKKMISQAPDHIGDAACVEAFQLYKIPKTTGYSKVYIGQPEDRNEFKCLDRDIHHLIVKYYYNKKITKNDLVFCHKGRLAHFLKAEDNPWK